MTVRPEKNRPELEQAADHKIKHHSVMICNGLDETVSLLWLSGDGEFHQFTSLIANKRACFGFDAGAILQVIGADSRDLGYFKTLAKPTLILISE